MSSKLLALSATAVLGVGCTNVPGPRLICASPDSLHADTTIRFDNAIYGQRGTTGGTRLFLVPAGATWQAIIEPIWSDFPGEDDRWPEAAESLLVQWRDLEAASGALEWVPPRQISPENRTVIGDSMTIIAACDTTILVNWRRTGVDTLQLERRPRGIWPY